MNHRQENRIRNEQLDVHVMSILSSNTQSDFCDSMPSNGIYFFLISRAVEFCYKIKQIYEVYVPKRHYAIVIRTLLFINIRLVLEV